MAVITDDGELHGWIGGSCSDALVRREALVAMTDGLPRLVRIRPDVEAISCFCSLVNGMALSRLLLQDGLASAPELRPALEAHTVPATVVTR